MPSSFHGMLSISDSQNSEDALLDFMTLYNYNDGVNMRTFLSNSQMVARVVEVEPNL